MKKRLFCSLFVLLLFAAVPLFAKRADDADRSSKNGRTEGEVGGVQVVVEYGRPNVKGRDIWGALVPFDKVWRTGANEAATITFSGNVVVEGQKLLAGTYGLFTIPGEKDWTVIFNGVAEQWGAFNYDQSEDALRVSVSPRAGEHVESMDFVLQDGELALRWAELVVPVQITTP